MRSTLARILLDPGSGAGGPLNTHKLFGIMKRKTAFIQIRLTDAEREEIKRKSLPFGSMSNYILQALKEFSDTSSLDRLRAAKTVADCYVDLDAKLAHVGGNLNQAMKHVNECAKTGIDISDKLVDVVLPEVHACRQLCADIRKTIYSLTKIVVHY